MRWLVTGGAGFIGSHIVERLVFMGESVRILDNFFTGKKEYLSPVLNKIEVLQGDIRDAKAVRRAMKNVDFVLHQGALRSVPMSISRPRDYDSVNVAGTLNCLILAREAKVQRFILASSSSVYGNSTKFPQKETDLPAPVSPYAASKIAGEHYCHVFAETYGLSAVALRYFNVFGPRQDPKSKYAAVIPKFIIAALKGDPLEIHWDGKQSRDFTYIEDVVQANICAALAKDIKYGVYNVARGDSRSLLDIAGLVEKCIGHPLKKKFFPKREGDVRKTFADVKAIQKDLKFKPTVPFETAIKNTYDFFVEKERWKMY
jgi:UDP-glucose 4-epimerase